MLTARGVALLVGAVLSWAIGRLLGIPEFSIVAVAGASLVGIGAIVTLASGSTVAVRRRLVASRIRVGTTTEIALELRNTGRLPVPLLLVEDHQDASLRDGDRPPRFVVPGLQPDDSARLSWTASADVRGRYQVGPVRIAMRDPFGTTQRVRRYRATDELVVYPRVEPLPQGGTWGTHRGAGASDTRRLFNTGDEFYMMREYVVGDDLRHVHWPSTAHRQKLMVRQHELPWHAQAAVFCDTRAERHEGHGPSASLERALSAAASVAWHLDERGYRQRFATEADLVAPAVLNRNDLMERLAVLQPTRGRSLAPALRGLQDLGAEGLLVAVLVPPTGRMDRGDRDLRALLQTGQAFTSRIALIVEPFQDGQTRAERFATMLRSTGWRTAVVGRAGSTADAWLQIVRSRPGNPRVSRPASLGAAE